MSDSKPISDYPVWQQAIIWILIALIIILGAVVVAVIVGLMAKISLLIISS